MNTVKKICIVLVLLVVGSVVFAQTYPYAKITKADMETYVKAYEKPNDTAAMLAFASLSPEKQMVLAAGVSYLFVEPVYIETYGKAMGATLAATVKSSFAAQMDKRDVATLDKNADIFLKSKALKELYQTNN